MKQLISMVLLVIGAWLYAADVLTNANRFLPGQPWYDSSGNLIRAHGGCVLFHRNTYYWYGEDRAPGSGAAVVCYTSTNLYEWNYTGCVLTRDALPVVDGRPTFVERPKVVFNPNTGRFVMWMHLEQAGYHYAHAGVAVADGPTNRFVFLRAMRPITNDTGFNEADPNRQKQLGGTFRDMTLFVDDDNCAYVIYASEDNHTIYVVRLNAEWTGPETPPVEGSTWARILRGKMREAPALFKHSGRYYLITSGCTGWRPNPADCAVATNIFGPWQMTGNPCRGPRAETTFDAQGAFVLPLPQKPGRFIFIADRWTPPQLELSRHVWVPLIVDEHGKCIIEWREMWRWEDL